MYYHNPDSEFAEYGVRGPILCVGLTGVWDGIIFGAPGFQKDHSGTSLTQAAETWPQKTCQNHRLFGALSQVDPANQVRVPGSGQRETGKAETWRYTGAVLVDSNRLALLSALSDTFSTPVRLANRVWYWEELQK
jgi:hypothetical protein